MACHEENPYGKFFGACNDLKMALDKCFVVSQSVSQEGFKSRYPRICDQIYPKEGWTRFVYTYCFRRRQSPLLYPGICLFAFLGSSFLW